MIYTPYNVTVGVRKFVRSNECRAIQLLLEMLDVFELIECRSLYPDERRNIDI
jgi:hypothetical protein